MKYMEIKQLKSLVKKALNLKAVFRVHSVYILHQNRKKKPKNGPGGSIPNPYHVKRMAQLSLGYS